MKRFKLAAVAAASLVVASFSHAGVLQLTPVQYAAETFSSTAAPVSAPLFSYSLSAPINTTSNPSFTFDFTLTGANWAYTAGVAQNIGATALVVSMKDPNVVGKFANASSVVQVSTNVFRATFNAASWSAGTGSSAAVFPVGSFVTVGDSAVGGSPAVVPTGATAAPALTCNPTPVNVSLAVIMKDSTGAQTNETNGVLDPILAQSGIYLVSNSGISSVVDVVAANEQSRIDVINTLGAQGPGSFFTTGATPLPADGTASQTTIQLGRVVIKDRGAFQDSTSTVNAPYSVIGGFASAGPAPAVALTGNANLSGATIKVNGNFSLTAGVAVNLTSDAACTTVIAGPFTPLATSAILTLTAAQLATFIPTGTAGTGAQTAYICYTVPVTNTAAIPASQFTLDASSAVTHHSSETGGPICGTNLYNLTQNGVRIDVRNVVARASAGYAAGFRSFLRVINTDENLSTVVNAQVIDNAGNVLGAKPLNGGLAIPPRGYIMVDNTQLETALAGSTSAGYTDAAGANVRIRLSAPIGTLRVQNYVLTPAGTFLEASGAQADEGTQPATSVFLNR